MKKFNPWLLKQKSIFKINVNGTKTENNNFAVTKYSFEDPELQGLSFVVYVDENDTPSVLTTEAFPIERLNIAEGYTPELLLEMAELILKGNIKITNQFPNRFKLHIGAGKNETVCKNDKKYPISKEIIEGYLHGYSR